MKPGKSMRNQNVRTMESRLYMGVSVNATGAFSDALLVRVELKHLLFSDLQLDLELVVPGIVMVHHIGDIGQPENLLGVSGGIDLRVLQAIRTEMLHRYLTLF